MIISAKIWNQAIEIAKQYNKINDFNIVLLICVYFAEKYFNKRAEFIISLLSVTIQKLIF